MAIQQKKERGAGILLPVSSLPSPYGIGTLGKEAYRFVDWLVKAGQKYWQVLPVGPTSFGDSPYQSFSAFAGNPYFIDLDILIEEGLLKTEDLEGINWGEKKNKVDYELLFQNRFPILRKAYEQSGHNNKRAYREFCKENRFWLNDYSFFMALKCHFNNKEWLLWEEGVRFLKKEACAKYRQALRDEIDFWKFCQYKFFEQWKKLKAYANEQGIKIIGDVPLYVSLDSADVWANGRLFELDERKNPIHVAGVPPDYFSSDGQLWGNPLYRWDVMESEDFEWWRERMQSCSKLYDVIRMDHFIGVVRYYAIPADADTAKKGMYRRGPGVKLTKVITETVGEVQMIAEDLGVVVPSVKRLINRTGWPGMKILQFAFDGNVDNEYLPHNFDTCNCVLYGGTHDNETLMGYFDSLKKKELRYVYEYLNITNRNEIPMAILRLAYSSIADLVIFQIQDILGLGNKARMNLPSTIGENWKWRLKSNQLERVNVKKIKKWIRLYGRGL